MLEIARYLTIYPITNICTIILKMFGKFTLAFIYIISDVNVTESTKPATVTTNATTERTTTMQTTPTMTIRTTKMRKMTKRVLSKKSLANVVYRVVINAKKVPGKFEEE